MPIAGRTANSPTDVRSLEAGALLIGAGALLLFISLFLDWYQPGLEAWTVFEAWDLVLAVLAVAALVAVAGRMGFGAARPASWLIVPALAALVIVVYAILDPPPATAGAPDGDPTTGLWLALVASILMALGALLSFARISVNISAAGPETHPPPPPRTIPPRPRPAGTRASCGGPAWSPTSRGNDPAAPPEEADPPAEAARGPARVPAAHDRRLRVRPAVVPRGAARHRRRPAARRAPVPRRARGALRVVNARRLRHGVADAGVAYADCRDPAPTTELRRLQYEADDRRGEGKRSRRCSSAVQRALHARILDGADLESLVAERPRDRSSAPPAVQAHPRPAIAR